MHVQIYRRTKNVMQSGKKGSADWRLSRPVTGDPRYGCSVMGWTGCSEPAEQLQSLSFESCEKAVAHANQMGYTYSVLPPAVPTPVIRSYADNFSGGAKW